MPHKIPYHKPAGSRPAAESYERARPRQEDKNFYAGTRWRKLRAAYLREQPLCKGEDCRQLAHHVDHILDRKDRPDLEYEWDNLQGLCQPCHNRKRGKR